MLEKPQHGGTSWALHFSVNGHFHTGGWTSRLSVETRQTVFALKLSFFFFNRQTNLDIFYVLHRVRSVLTRGSVCLRVYCLSKPSFPPVGHLPVRNRHFMLKFVQIVYFYSKFCNFFMQLLVKKLKWNSKESFSRFLTS